MKNRLPQHSFKYNTYHDRTGSNLLSEGNYPTYEDCLDAAKKKLELIWNQSQTWEKDYCTLDLKNLEIYSNFDCRTIVKMEIYAMDLVPVGNSVYDGPNAEEENENLDYSQEDRILLEIGKELEESGMLGFLEQTCVK